MKIETVAVHAGRHVDPPTGAITPPIHLSTTFERSREGGYPSGFSYSRENNPNRKALEQCLAALDGGKEALAFSSGLGAATAVIQGLEPGDHILATSDVYYAFRRILGEVFAKWPLEIDWVDMTDLDAARAAMRPNTRLIWLETPTNPLLKVCDLDAIGEMARKTRAVTVCDATFATPVLLRPLEHSIDMVMHSTTKYISGHSDVVGGSLTTLYDNYLFERCRKFQRIGGAVPSPFDCWLMLRGIDTLPLRVRAQSANALALARFLEKHPSVERVNYPGLESHPQHALARKWMPAFGGMLSFEVRGGKAEAMRIAARTRLFIRATSLGGTHSLIEHRASIEGPKTRTPQGLLRLSTGIEHIDDLIADLDQAMAAG